MTRRIPLALARLNAERKARSLAELRAGKRPSRVVRLREGTLRRLRSLFPDERTDNDRVARLLDWPK